MILFAHMDSKDLYFIIFLYKKNGCRRSFCVDVYTTKGIRFHESNRIDSCILMKFSAYKIRIS